MAKYENDVVSWITVNGNHIPIKPGQTVEQAISERFDNTDDTEIEVETDDLDKEIESDTLYYFSGYNPHEITKEEYENGLKNNPKYYETLQLTQEMKDLMSDMLTDENVNDLTYGQLVNKCWDKLMFYGRNSAERRAILSRFKTLALEKYKDKAKKVLGEIPKTSDNNSETAVKQNSNNYIKSLDAPYKSEERKAYTYNCQRCVIAYEMIRRGYNVSADSYQNDRLGIYHNNLRRSFLNFNDDLVHGYDTRPDGTLYSGKGQLFKAMETDMLKEPEGSRFVLEWDWKGERSGHTINAEKINGQIMIYDSQINFQKPLKEYLKLRPNIRPRTINWTRVDNLDLSGDLKGVVKW